MSFWGIEVKPGKPVTHSCEKARGRLRISQATLGFGDAVKKSVVQCNVGKRAPVLVCALLPDKTESCHLDLEFEEADDVVFSVIGPRSVYLTGYYVRQSSQLNANSDTESYGVDIENTQTEGSSYGSDEEKYDDSFIDDDAELQFSPQSPVLSNKGMYDDTPESDKPRSRKGRSKQRKKKFQVMDSDNDGTLSPEEKESEDEDAYTLSAFRGKRVVKQVSSDAEKKVDDLTAEVDEANNEGLCDETKQKIDPYVPNTGEVAVETSEIGNEANHSSDCDELKPKVDPSDLNDKLGRAIKLPPDEEGDDVGNEKKDLPNPKEIETCDGIISSNEDFSDQNLFMATKGKDQMQSHDIVKPKKKRKERPMREEKTCEVQTESADHNVIVKYKMHEVDALANMETDINSDGNPIETNSISDQKVKRRKTEELQTEEIDKTCLKYEDAIMPFLNSNSSTKDLLGENGEYQEQQIEEIGTKHHIVKEGHGDCMTVDPPLVNEEVQDRQLDNDTSLNLESDSQSGKKNKKKKKKAQSKRGMDTGSLEKIDGDENTNTVAIQKRTLSNGLIIEELENGLPDGKVAAPGKKVKIFYTAMLKENGFVFDSNVGKCPFKFQLGDEEFIDGWNAGIEGMRVGDKRRLTIPPSMGFGSHGVGENVPPNSWLVYEIELVSVRK